MKSMISSAIVVVLSLGLSGAIIGCTASGSIEPDHTSTSTNGSSSSVKKTEVRDANGNLVEKKVETKINN